MHRMIILTVASLMLISSAHATDLPDGKPEEVGMSSSHLDRIPAVMKTYVEDGHVPGIVTVVTRRGKLVHFHAQGLRDMEKGLPYERDTIFRIYSMSKPITGVAAMILYEEGAFELGDPIADHLPAFTDARLYVSGHGDSIVTKEPERAPTVQDVLTHSAGLVYGGGPSAVDSLYSEADIWESEDLADFTAKIGAIPLLHEPGSKWHYSVSMDIIGSLVEAKSGMKFSEFLQTRIFGPLGMKDTGFYVPEDKVSRFASKYSWSDSTGALSLVDEEAKYLLPPEIESGGGGLVSTVDDYLRFCQMLLNEGEYNGQRILGPRTVRYMLSDHLRPGVEVGPGLGMGPGFGILTNPALNSRIGNAGEAGWAGAANTFFWVDPQEQMISMVWTQMVPWGIRDFRHQMVPLVHAAILE